tara:strand:+ start:513 stop:842 length:330 start_codon:yes stop_codon:yes gene_type:complete
LGQEPDPDKMPLDASVFPEEVQAAFFVYNLMPDRWEGMNGVYLGKDWSSFPIICDVYSLSNIKETFFFAKLYETLQVTFKSQKAHERQKADQRKQQAASGETFTHNVTG